MTTIFGELDFRLSVVQRWAVVSTVRKQSVAEHSYNVAILSERIAREWFSIDDDAVLFALVRRALYHDWRESITGDPPSYMKWAINEVGIDAVFGDYIEDHEVDLHPGPEAWANTVRGIVKVADYIDALIFLHMEVSHGNRSIVPLMRNLEHRFKVTCRELGVTVSETFTMVPELYRAQVWDQLFGPNGQYETEVYRFK